MGCLNSSLGQKKLRARAHSNRKISFVWVETKDEKAYECEPTAEEWQDILAVANILRSQGTLIDVFTFAFERMFVKTPKLKAIFADAGILSLGEEFKGNPRFRGHIREISASLFKIIELKNTDADGFSSYIRDIRDIHLKIKEFDLSFFELFAQSLDYSISNSLGSAITPKQRIAFRKFVIFICKTLYEDTELSAKTDSKKPVKEKKD